MKQMCTLDDQLLEMKGYSYRIWAYGLGHSTLILRATHTDKHHHNAHVSFSDVQYFQFPLGWTGDLVPASDDELLVIMARAGMGMWAKSLPVSEIRERFHLYKADTKNGTIYILGHLYEIEYDVEPVYN
jgi:hypothetical protein